MPENEDLVVRFSPRFAWMMIIFGGLFFVIGILITMPFMAQQDIPLGIAIAFASVAAMIGGRYWLYHLPVMLLMSSAGLEIRRKKMTYQWSDIEAVEIKKIFVPPHEVSYLCLRFRQESLERYKLQPGSVWTRDVMGMAWNCHLYFNHEEFSLPVETLRDEIKKRIFFDNSAASMSAVDIASLASVTDTQRHRVDNLN